MPRNARIDVGDEIYHVINRANGRMQIFNNNKDYQLFEKFLLDAKELTDMRILAYAIMPNHWHLVLHPKNDGDLGVFMHRLTNAHTRQVHVDTKTIGSGHLYQGRYKSFLVEEDAYLLTAIKYIERNPVRGKLVTDPKDYPWSSYACYADGTDNALVDEDPYYASLGSTAYRRQEAYREFASLESPYATILDTQLLDEPF